ncbi:hypothetical protein GTO89_07870 [Heliobacterium gestii]|uniref:YcdB/YcdC repeated domain-containing protein n=1 Tax=Heliomicrobium gestii TaxID=2699 RepID=A0A845LE91_HELGE|nr:YcdB/YcdC domain-containing protein [Heliomicrobium gestii]MBM7866255.1 hypothetical protein [Heliomicrobium gestii]MZP42949.1 hypothetical protein [Heliomicrobium gestii]
MSQRGTDVEKKGMRRPAQAALAGVVLTGMLVGAFPVTALAADTVDGPAAGETSAATTPSGVEATSATRPGAAATGAGASSTATVRSVANDPTKGAKNFDQASPEVEARIQRVVDLFGSLYPEFRSLSLQIKSRSTGGHRHDGKPVEEDEWTLFFGKEQPNEKPKKGQIANQVHMNFDQSGALNSYSWQNPDWAGTPMPDKETTVKKATEFLQGLLGDEFARYASGNADGSGRHGTTTEDGKQLSWVHRSIRFDRLINGIPLMDGGDNWDIDVDGNGRIIGVHHSIHETPNLASFPDPSKAIGLEAARKVYAERAQMTLSYQPQEYLNQSTEFPYRQIPGRAPMVLSYQTDGYLGPIDALTGKAVEGSSPGLLSRTKETLLRVTGQGKALFAKTPEEGRKLIEKELGVDMAGMSLAKFPPDEEKASSEPYIKSLHWDDHERMNSLSAKLHPERFQSRYATLELESDTGRVCGFSIGQVFGDENERMKQVKQASPISAEEAKKKAVSFLQRFLPARTVEMKVIDTTMEAPQVPEWVDVSKLPKDYMESPVYDFLFFPLHNGVPVQGILWHVSIDKASGKVWAFTYMPLDADKLPANSGLISPEAAKAAFLNNLDLKLVYSWPQFFDQRAPKPMLVYMLDYQKAGVIDAKSGKIIPYLTDK